MKSVGNLAKKTLVFILFVFLSAVAAQDVTFTVTKTADANDGMCDADCSLREAIAQVNANRTGVVSAGNNLIGFATGFAPGTPNSGGDYVGSAVAPLDPQLAPHGNNGSENQTYALFAGSPAIDHSNSVGDFPATDDQRRTIRPQGAGIGVAAKLYQFEPRVLTLNDSLRDIDFMPIESLKTDRLLF